VASEIDISGSILIFLINVVGQNPLIKNIL